MFQHLEDRLKGAQLIHLSRRQQNELPVVKFRKSNETYLQGISFINQLTHSVDTVVDVKICVI